MSTVYIIIVIISHQITGFAIHQYWNDDDGLPALPACIQFVSDQRPCRMRGRLTGQYNVWPRM